MAVRNNSDLGLLQSSIFGDIAKMIMAMDDARLQPFIEDIAAMTIVGQAVMKCRLRGVAVTADNIVFFIGDFFDPNDSEFGDLITKINSAIDDVLASGSYDFQPLAVGE